MVIRKASAIFAVALAGLSTAAASTPAMPVGDSFTLGIRGFVPVICRADVQASQITPASGVNTIGVMKEFCNSPSGYQVWADYSASLSDAALLVDGRRVELSATGSTLISESAHAAITSRDLAIDLPDGDRMGALSLRIVAL